MRNKWDHRVVSDEAPADGVAGSPPASVPAAPEAPVASSNVDWESLAKDEPGVEIAPTETPVAAAPAVAPAKVEPAAAPKVEPPATPAVVVEPKVEAPKVEPPPPATPTPPATPAAPQLTHADITRQIQEQRGRFLTDLENMYRIPEVEAPQLVAEPETVIPKLLARAHMAVMDQVADYMNKVLPQMMENVQQSKANVETTVGSFYKEWPELNKPEYTETVARSLAAYRSANPTAKPEDVIREGGLTALIGLRLPLPDRIMKAHNADAPPVSASATFVPATAGSAPKAPPATPSNNPFTVLAQEDLVEGQ